MCEKYFSLANTCKARVDQLGSYKVVPEEFLGSGSHALEVSRQLQIRWVDID